MGLESPSSVTWVTDGTVTELRKGVGEQMERKSGLM